MKGYLSEEGVDRDTDELTSWLGSERGRPVGPVVLPNGKPFRAFVIPSFCQGKKLDDK